MSTPVEGMPDEAQGAVFPTVDSSASRDQVMAAVAQTVFHGPIPPPEQFARYDQILPGAADRILRMAENEQAHCHALERATLDHQAHNSYLGLWLGFAALLVLASAALISAYLGYPTLAAGFFGTTALGLIPAFINGRGLIRWPLSPRQAEADAGAPAPRPAPRPQPQQPPKRLKRKR